MALKIDHIVLAGSDLDELSTWFESISGVAPSPGGRHIGWGTWNRLVSLGPRTYLELIAPDPSQPEPAGPRPLGVDGLDSGEHRVTSFACRAPGIESVIEKSRQLGYDPGDAFPMSRVLPDGTEVHWKLTLPNPDFGDGLVPFLIDWGETPPPPSSLPHKCLLRSLTVGHPNPSDVEHALSCLGVKMDVGEWKQPGLTMAIDSPYGPLEIG